MRLCGEDDLPVWVDAMGYAPNVLVYSRILAAGDVRLSEENMRKREQLKRLAFAREVAGRRVHAMHLLDGPWEQIASGEKRCELRRLDAKRKRVLAGDLVVFSRLGNPDDIIAADVLECRTAACFGDLMRDEEVVAASGFHSAEEAVAGLRGIYGDEPCPAVAIFLDTSCWTHGGGRD
jgi:ASC-1-like (ASCH) protein